MTGKFPFFVLDIRLAPQLVDVNVHPAKTEIKFANEKEVYDIIDRFLDREFDPDGKGSLFWIPNCRFDLRDTEIWIQMLWYLDTIT